MKFIYTSLTPANAFDYLTNVTATAGYGVNSNEPAYAADTIQVNPDTALDTNWLAQVQDNGGDGNHIGGRLRGHAAPVDAGNLAQRKIAGRNAVVFEHQRRGADVPA